MAPTKLILRGDGTTGGSELIDAETGENLFQRYAIAAVRVEITGGAMAGPKVTLELHPALVAVEIASRSDQAILDILYPGLTEAYHLHGGSGIEEAPPVEKGAQA